MHNISSFNIAPPLSLFQKQPPRAVRSFWLHFSFAAGSNLGRWQRVSIRAVRTPSIAAVDCHTRRLCRPSRAGCVHTLRMPQVLDSRTSASSHAVTVSRHIPACAVRWYNSQRPLETHHPARRLLATVTTRQPPLQPPSAELAETVPYNGPNHQAVRARPANYICVTWNL